MGPPQPKTITHMHPEPVSEVFLTNGTILRQTHYGTTPRDSPLIESSAESSPAKSRKAGSNAADLSLKLDLKQQLGGGQIKSEGQKAKSPYMLIKSTSIEEGGSEPPLTVVNQEEGTIKKDQIANTTTTTTTTNPSKITLIATTNSSDDDENGLFAQNKPAPPRMDTNNIKAIFGNDDEDNDEDINAMFVKKSRGNSEVDSAEEVEDKSRISKTLVRQNRVDQQKQCQKGGVIVENLLKLEDTKLSVPRSKRSSSFTEFPKVKELNVERIEYLTPKEVKAMQVARRRRNEWESRIKAAKDQGNASPCPRPKLAQEALDITEDHFNNTGPVSERVSGSTKSSRSKTNTLGSRVSKNKKHLRNQILRRLVQPNVESSEEESDIKKKGGRKVPVTTVDLSKSPTPSSTFKPVKIEQDIPAHAHPLHQDSVQAGSLSPETPIKSQMKNCSKNTSVGPDFNKLKKMGHRRMKSAPLRMATLGDRLVESELTPKSPFVYISPAPAPAKEEQTRARSYSMGTKKQKKEKNELTRLAELVVQEDRRDVERDVPEVLQVYNYVTTRSVKFFEF